MNEELKEIINESINLELNVGNLYKLFSNTFSKDYDFWKKISLEEENHARLIKTGRDILLDSNEFPKELLCLKLQTLTEVNKKLTSIIKNFQENPLSREEAFNLAIYLEESAGEIHFQGAMEKTSGSNKLKIFQQLNNDDKDHALRIRNYMKENGIKQKK